MARDVKFMLQNGLRFMLRESHLLKESHFFSKLVRVWFVHLNSAELTVDM